jgi:uncharacterized protein YjbI with pentapeptide repeats
VKGLLKFLVGAVLGGVLGWGLGYLRIPLIENNGSFWIGFAVSLSVVLFVVAGLFVWNKNALLMKAIGRNSGGQTESNPARAYRLVWVMIALFVAGGGTVSGWMIYRQNTIWTARIEDLKKTILNQAELVESIRKSNQGFLMGNVLDKIDAELALRPEGPLSEATIDRVAALSHSLKPYRYFEGDTLSSKELSPERGQLLLALVNMGIDSASWAAIKSKATFAGADLSGANLRGKDLSGMNLRGANFRGGDCQRINLTKANLRYAQLYAINLNGSTLNNAILEKTDLRWADMSNVTAESTSFNGSNLSNANLNHGWLKQASFRFGVGQGLLLQNANLDSVDMMGTQLDFSNFEGAKLKNAHLRWASLFATKMAGTNLNGLRVSFATWPEIFKEWKMETNTNFENNFQVMPDSSKLFGASYFLRKK